MYIRQNSQIQIIEDLQSGQKLFIPHNTRIQEQYHLVMGMGLGSGYLLIENYNLKLNFEKKRYNVLIAQIYKKLRLWEVETWLFVIINYGKF